MFIFLSLYSLLDNYYIFFYALQQYLSSYLFLISSPQSIFIYVILFFLGIVTILTPCFISILPLAVSYINSQKSYNLDILFFICGLLTSFIVLMLFTNLLGFSVVSYNLPIISYIVLIIVALNFMEVLRFNIPFERYFSIFLYDTIFPKIYLIGVTIGLSSLPCNSYILFIVTFIIHNVNNIFFSSLYILIYLLGCILPLIFVFKVKFNYSSSYFLSFVWKSIFPLSGSFLFIFSFFSLLKFLFV
uniref:Thiol:disulfide interchange protein n=1 Tax=Dipterosiphonia australica TaxID=2007208 RepID=A0A1Z1ML23_9FLOR|nr:thiol:disulfide interchange protein [Dipterosiphonia australica]ARW66758.1 thiol:disulfide interchange protein [Dipterosiphonia australica]